MGQSLAGCPSSLQARQAWRKRQGTKQEPRFHLLQISNGAEGRGSSSSPSAASQVSVLRSDESNAAASLKARS